MSDIMPHHLRLQTIHNAYTPQIQCAVRISTPLERCRNPGQMPTRAKLQYRTSIYLLKPVRLAPGLATSPQKYGRLIVSGGPRSCHRLVRTGLARAAACRVGPGASRPCTDSAGRRHARLVAPQPLAPFRWWLRSLGATRVRLPRLRRRGACVPALLFLRVCARSLRQDAKSCSPGSLLPAHF